MNRRAQHPIQRSILEQLRVSPVGLRYRDLKPPLVENDLFNYHLQYLTKQNLVAKSTGRYALSPSGKKHLIELNPVDDTGQPTRFKLAALCLLIVPGSSGEQVLYQQRSRQPFAGQWALIGGGMKRGEPATQAATRRLREEAGLKAAFELIGLMRKIHFDLNGDVYSDILFHVCLSRHASGHLIAQNSFGNQVWMPLDEAVSVECSDPIGSRQLADIIARIAAPTAPKEPLFYLDETYRHDIY